MATHTSIASLFSDIANAIRAKTGGSSQIVADNFPAAIATIPAIRAASVKARASSATSITFTGLQGQPKSFSMFYQGSVGPIPTSSSNRMTFYVIFDGANTITFRVYRNTTTNHSIYYSYTTSVSSWTYNNGTLVLTSAGLSTSTDAYYNLVYTY